MRKIFFVSSTLLLLLGVYSCATLAPKPMEPVNLTGSADFASEPFDIRTKEWQINWEYKAQEKQPPTFVL